MTREDAHLRGTPSVEHTVFKFPTEAKAKQWDTYVYDETRYWGEFSREVAGTEDMFREAPWAIGPFAKHPSNPILEPTPGAWDSGRFDGGVHNGAIVVHKGSFYYVYRGERPLDMPLESEFDYMCDIGLATSRDGVHFTKDTVHSPLFRKGADRRYSYEDVNLVEYEGIYYLFCNQWDWERHDDPAVSGTFLATSKDLVNWKKHGIVFPKAKRTHRNGVVLQDPHNRAVKLGGRFIMYLNDGLVAFSDDLVHWESRDANHRWPGGEGCLAITGHSSHRPEDIVLFTGGNHTGHFYAIGEVLFNRSDPERPVTWLPRPVLAAEPEYPWEAGLDARPPHQPVSSFRDCVFFNALTLHNGRWWLYYGGSEYYTCLATADAR